MNIALDIVARNDGQLAEIVSCARSMVDAFERLYEGTDTDDAFERDGALASNEGKLEAAITRLLVSFSNKPDPVGP